MQRHVVPVLLLTLLLLSACRNPDVAEDQVVMPPDTAVVDEPLIDPGEVDPQTPPGDTRTAAEMQARQTILEDVNVVEAQVLEIDGIVRITAVLTPEGVDRAELKAEQFVAAAMRHLERAGSTPDAEDLLGPSRLGYDVTLRDREQETVFSGFKSPDASEFVQPSPLVGEGGMTAR